MTPEGRVRNQICSYLTLTRVFSFVHDSIGIYSEKKKRYLANKNPYRIKGVSDILGVYKGHLLAIEVKTDTIKDLLGKTIQYKGYPTDEQKNFLERVKREGGVAFIARSIEDVKRGLREWEDSHTPACPCYLARTPGPHDQDAGAREASSPVPPES